MNPVEKRLNELYAAYNHLDFIKNDPISVPHQFSLKQDIEIAGFFAAILAWGNRKSIINSAQKIITAMDNSPYEFITQHQPKDLISMQDIKHRTFNSTDLLYCIEVLKLHYQKHNSLENAFFTANEKFDAYNALSNFNSYFFSLSDAPLRTQKHIASPKKNSACKRLNMYLRWMVRKDKNGVDFGIWNKIAPFQLMMPLDVHVVNSAAELLQLINIKPNWKGVCEVTQFVANFDPNDPVKYDYALFGYQIEKKMI